MNIERLQTKKAALTAQREQHMANINATIGAIAMVDELLQEAVADQVREKTEAEQKHKDAAHAEHMAKMAPPPPPEIERAAADALKVKLDPQDVQRVSRPFDADRVASEMAPHIATTYTEPPIGRLCYGPADVESPSIMPDAPAEPWPMQQIDHADAESRN